MRGLLILVTLLLATTELFFQTNNIFQNGRRNQLDKNYAGPNFYFYQFIEIEMDNSKKALAYCVDLCEIANVPPIAVALVF